MAYITSGLLEVLLEIAEDRDPEPVSIALAVTPARELEIRAEPDDPIADDSPVFTDMYLPETGRSVTAVFGMDLSTPGTAGRFLSHPDGGLALTKRDDLHVVVFVAVPPYDREDVAAFDRAGQRIEFEDIDAIPPNGSLQDYSR
ncbi:MAG: hypothetical protein ACOCQ7_00700 [Natronomonas sp.]